MLSDLLIQDSSVADIERKEKGSLSGKEPGPEICCLTVYENAGPNGVLVDDSTRCRGYDDLPIQRGRVFHKSLPSEAVRQRT